MAILVGGAIRRLFTARRKAGFPVVRSALGAAKDRLVGDGKGNKGVLQSRTQIGAAVAAISGALAAFGVQIGENETAAWGERLYYAGIVVGFILTWTGRDRAVTPIAGSKLAEKNQV